MTGIYCRNIISRRKKRALSGSWNSHLVKIQRSLAGNLFEKRTDIWQCEILDSVTNFSQSSKIKIGHLAIVRHASNAIRTANYLTFLSIFFLLLTASNIFKKRAHENHLLKLVFPWIQIKEIEESFRSLQRKL